MNNIKKVILDAIGAIENTTNLFYQNKTTQGYECIIGMLDAIALAMKSLDEYKLEENKVNVNEIQINSILTEAMKAMEMKDMLMMSDILNYELKETLVNIVNNLD